MFFPSVLFKVDIVERKFLAKVLVSCKKKKTSGRCGEHYAGNPPFAGDRQKFTKL